MNVLEKILEEIKEKIKFAEKLMVEKPCDKLDKIANDTAESYILACEECCKIICSHMDDAKDTNVPSKWIPVSKRLPEAPRENPIFDNKPLELYMVDIGEHYPLRAFWNGKDFTDGWSKLEVIAYQPLPEPYKGE